MSVIIQFLNSPCQDYWDAIMWILKYIKNASDKGLIYEDKGNTQIVGHFDADWVGSPNGRLSTSGYCVLVGGNLMLKSTKPNVVSGSSEVEHRVMRLVTCEVTWLKQLLKDLKFKENSEVHLICDNQATLHIATIPAFLKRTEYFEVDYHFTREKLDFGDTTTRFVNSSE